MRELDSKMLSARVGSGPAEGVVFIEASSCVNVAMMGLLTPNQISCICKRLATRTVNLIVKEAMAVKSLD